MKLTLAGAVALGVVAAITLVPSPTTAAPAAPPQRAQAIQWGSCSDPTLEAFHAQCGTLPVPLDYSKPNGTTITLAVSRVKHTVPDAQYQGVMLVNPGGPGGSGLELSILGSFVPNGAGNYYDWIGFDPRGVGSSVPRLSCDPHYFDGPRPFYLPIATTDLNAWLARSAGYAHDCAAHNPAGLLKHLTTIDSARDMDSIRVALGARKINYYGFSYGTYLGQVYASLFPSHLRRAVFDGVVNAGRIWYDANLDQDYAFNRNIKIWFGWLARYDSVYHLGATERAVEALFYKTAVAQGNHPAGGVVGYDEWIDTFLAAGYYQLTWLDEAAVFAGYIHDHDVQTLIDTYDANNGVGDDNGYAIYDGVQCTDVQWPQSWAKWRSDNWRVFAQAPYETWANAWFNAPCLYWPAPAHTPATIKGTGVPPILLVSETLDAATPYSGALATRSRFPNSRLLALPGGTTHAGSLFGDACEDDLIAAYLATGALPARKPGTTNDATCAPLPQPVPTAAAARTTASTGAAKAVRRALLATRR